MECPQCHENSVIEDEYYCQQQLVCEKCGFVVSDEFLKNEASNVGENQNIKSTNDLMSSVPWEIRRKFYKKSSPAVKTGRQRIDYLASMLNLSEAQKSCSLHLYERSVILPEFKALFAPKKEALAVACVYINLRQNECPVTQAQLCSLTGVLLSHLNDIVVQVSNKFDIQITTTAIENAVPVFLRDCQLEEKKVIVEKTTKILILAKRLWVADAKKPELLMSVCAYIAWSSLDIGSRVKMNYRQFCEKHSVKYFASGSNRLRDVMDMLRKLCEQLPWMNKKNASNKRHLLYSLDSILATSKSLCFAAVGSRDDEHVRKHFVKEKPKKEKNDEDYCCDERAIPPVSMRPELTEDDIPDEEMHHFIRSDEEVKQILSFSLKHD